MKEVDFGDSFSTRRMLVYLLLECGDSMKGVPKKAVEQGVLLILNELMGQPQSVEMVHISVIAYSTFAQQILPLTPITNFVLPPLVAGGSNNLGNALHVLADCIKKDRVKSTPTRQGDYPETVFWITAHEPTDDWMEGIRYLKEINKNSVRNIVAIKAGNGVEETTLKCITTNVILLEELTPDQIVRAFNYLIDVDVVVTMDIDSTNLPPPPNGFDINL